MSRKISKSHFIILLVIIPIIFLLTWSNQRLDDPLDDNLEKTGIPLIQVFDGVMYHYDKNGKNNLILKSNQTDYYRSEKGTIFYAPVLEEIKPHTVNTLSADIAIENQDKTQVDLQGNVKITRPNPNDPQQITTMTTDQAYYFINKGEADTNKMVTIITPESTTHGDGASWNLNSNLFKLKQNIRSKYEADSGNSNS